jgi:RNA polymerase sigma-70 factor (ECF subfamily)
LIIKNGEEDIIIACINKKNLDGYKYIYANYYTSLCNFSTRFSISKKDAEDIVQNVILKLWENSAKFNSFKALKAFLYTSVKNSCINAIRNKSRKSEIELSEHAFLNLNTELESIEALIVEEEYYRQIHLVIGQLSPEREKVILHSMEGLSNQEIALKIGVSINTVKTLKLKAYRFLRENLKQAALLFLIFQLY